MNNMYEKIEEESGEGLSPVEEIDDWELPPRQDQCACDEPCDTCQ